MTTQVDDDAAQPLAVLAAGGTGGHLFPAQALAEELMARGWRTVLMSEARAREYAGRFPATEIIEVPSSTITPRRPWRVPGQLWRLWRGWRLARHELATRRPAVVVGFGGYPSLPTLVAAQGLGIPTLIHEQNAVLGRANRLLARRARVVATSFPEVAGLAPEQREKVAFTGNPVRRSVLAAARTAGYVPPEAADEPFSLLVFGGSQGARFFSEVMPAVIRELPGVMRRNLHLVQQCRPEDLERVQATYREMKVTAILKSFFDDLPQRMAWAHLVIARAGASTVAELAVTGRPAILVPLPHALDNDQLRNARAFAQAGAGWVMEQAQITPEKMAAFLTRLRYDTTGLRAAHEAALRLARPDAARILANVVEEVALTL